MYHTAFGQLDYAIGGYFAMATSPLYPLFETTTLTTDEDECDDEYGCYTYWGSDMNFFVFTGANDEMFPPEWAAAEIDAIFNSMESTESGAPQLRYFVTHPELGHDEDCRYYGVMMDWVRNGTVSSIED